jgi:hypothetical protein
LFAYPSQQKVDVNAPNLKELPRGYIEKVEMKITKKTQAG